MMAKNQHAVALGRKGGKVTSDSKAAASRANGQKGGTPPLLTPEHRVILWREAKRLGISIAELVRRIIDRHIEAAK